MLMVKSLLHNGGDDKIVLALRELKKGKILIKICFSILYLGFQLSIPVHWRKSHLIHCCVNFNSIVSGSIITGYPEICSTTGAGMIF